MTLGFILLTCWGWGQVVRCQCLHWERNGRLQLRQDAFRMQSHSPTIRDWLVHESHGVFLLGASQSCSPHLDKSNFLRSIGCQPRCLCHSNFPLGGGGDSRVSLETWCGLFVTLPRGQSRYEATNMTLRAPWAPEVSSDELC